MTATRRSSTLEFHTAFFRSPPDGFITTTPVCEEAHYPQPPPDGGIIQQAGRYYFKTDGIRRLWYPVLYLEDLERDDRRKQPGIRQSITLCVYIETTKKVS